MDAWSDAAPICLSLSFSVLLCHMCIAQKLRYGEELAIPRHVQQLSDGVEQFELTVRKAINEQGEKFVPTGF